MTEPTIGFIGLGRLGSVIASTLVDAGHRLVCCSRGRFEELVAKGAHVAGDGSSRDVAQLADIVFTCLPGDGMEAAFDGPDGVLAAQGKLPLVVELSTADLHAKARLREQLAQRDGELLDCPISGTPAMVASGIAVIYASGDPGAYERVAGLLRDVSPGTAYVGALGAGTKMKYVANLLALVHVSAASEAMAFAGAMGLDLDAAAELLVRSPAATSGQLAIRAPMIAAGDHQGRLVTIADARENLHQITVAAQAAGAPVPLTSTAKDLFDELAEDGDVSSDPAKLAWLLARQAGRDAP